MIPNLVLVPLLSVDTLSFATQSLYHTLFSGFRSLLAQLDRRSDQKSTKKAQTDLNERFFLSVTMNQPFEDCKLSKRCYRWGQNGRRRVRAQVNAIKQERNLMWFVNPVSALFSGERDHREEYNRGDDNSHNTGQGQKMNKPWRGRRGERSGGTARQIYFPSPWLSSRARSAEAYFFS